MMYLFKYFPISIIGFFLILTSQNAFSAELPPPPKGYTWYTAKTGAGYYLVPENWYVKEEAKNGINTVYISNEDINKTGKLVSGYTARQFTSYSKKNSIKPTEYARQYIKEITDKHEVMIAGDVTGWQGVMNVARVKMDKSGAKTIVHNIALGIDELDELYLITFEAPEKDWVSVYMKGWQLLSYVYLGSKSLQH